MAVAWNYDTQGMCIVHPAWRIRSSHAFVVSLAMIFLISVFYEYLKYAVRCIDCEIDRTAATNVHGLRRVRHEGPGNSAAALRPSRSANARKMTAVALNDTPYDTDTLRERETEPEALTRPRGLPWKMPLALQTPSRLRGLRSCAYGLQVFISCFLMLVMMSYNAWLISVIVLGATAGNFWLGHRAEMAKDAEDAHICH
ncbi:copper transpport protein [Malassezia vespertilionis]|uniref:Copper transport protein n=1 Tax=Malassezia vespertilionis TaxID=2020962 RepID=A0A2N1JBV2_9BASI|nr:copper transpport protein [Malassezia vespertilionis]PKI84034.1 hypothetical protein MVES_002058 [Malassezia vespertilionis]WFD06829.1 copper transpport protein [Malassezia vespertilionis]